MSCPKIIRLRLWMVEWPDPQWSKEGTVQNWMNRPPILKTLYFFTLEVCCLLWPLSPFTSCFHAAVPLLKSLCANAMNTGNVSMAGSPYCKLISWKSLIQVLLNSLQSRRSLIINRALLPFLWDWWVRCKAADNGCQVWQSNHLLGENTSNYF